MSVFDAGNAVTVVQVLLVYYQRAPSFIHKSRTVNQLDYT